MTCVTAMVRLDFRLDDVLDEVQRRLVLGDRPNDFPSTVADLKDQFRRLRVAREAVEAQCNVNTAEAYIRIRDAEQIVHRLEPETARDQGLTILGLLAETFDELTKAQPTL